MNAPPMEAPPQQPMKNKGGGRPPSGGGGGGGRREPNLFDKVSNFVADSGTIAVLKVSCVVVIYFALGIMFASFCER